MYSGIIKKLKEREFELEKGLDDNEICKVENMYNIKFPMDLRIFYSEALPVGDGFYNWRDFSKINVDYIQCMIDRPFHDIEENIQNIEWSEMWGTKPQNNQEKSEYIINMLERSPKLIPIYKHRYMANQYDYSNPIFSIYGLDIIYYGENLEQYFDIELRYKKHSDIKYKNIRKIDFWSDLL